MSYPPAVVAEIKMFRHEGGWRVEIREQTTHAPGWRAFAATEAKDIDRALHMAMPHLAALSEPDSSGPAVEEQHRRDNALFEQFRPSRQTAGCGDKPQSPKPK